MDKVPGAEGAGKFYEEHAVKKEKKTPPSKTKEVGIRTIASSAAAAEAEKSRSSSSSEGSRSTSPTSETSSDSGVSGLSGASTPQSKASTRSDYSSVSSSEVGACTIGLMPSDYSEFVHKALDLHKDDFVKTLPPTEKAAFMKKSPGEQKKDVYKWMTDPTREVNNEKPRLEMRQCFNMPGVCANVALCCKDGPTRDALFENFTVPGVADDLNLVQAGSTTIEISSKGVDKSTPIRFLQDQENFQALLSNIGYTPGPLINALQTKTVIISDADGTIWGKPETGKPVESANLLNSEAKAGV